MSSTGKSLAAAALILLACGCDAGSFSVSFNGTSISRNNGEFTVRIDNGPILVGSGKAGEDKRAAADFSKLVAQAGVDVLMDDAAGGSITVEADDNLLPLVETTVTDDTLHVRIIGSLSTRNPLQVKIPVRQLSDISADSSARVTAGKVSDSAVHLEASSSGQITVAEVQGDEIELAASSSGKITAAKVEGKELRVEVSSSGRIIVAGNVDKQSVQADSSGSYEAGDLASRSAVVNCSSSGSATVQAKEDVTGAAASSGRVRYSGNPARVSIETSSSGSASPADR